MFPLRLFAKYSNLASQFINDQKIIIAFVTNFIKENKIRFPRTWKSPQEGQNFEAGIGGYSGNPGIATGRVHLEVKDGKLLCFDKNREQGGLYIKIEDESVQAKVFSKFAVEIRNPGKGGLQDLDKILDKAPENAVKPKTG